MKKVQSLYWLLCMLLSGTFFLQADQKSTAQKAAMCLPYPGTLEALMLYARVIKPYWHFPFQIRRSFVPLSGIERKELLMRTCWLLSHEKSKARIDRAVKKIVHLGKISLHHECYAYPWDDLEEHCAKHGIRAIPLLQYGSLMHQSCNSAERAFGFCVKRIFNYALVHPELSFLGLPNDKHRKEAAQLNVAYTGCTKDVIEGVVGTISLRDLPLLRARERGYDLIKIPVLFHAHLDDPKVSLAYAYVLSCPCKSVYVRRAQNLTPNINYLNLCAESLHRNCCSVAHFFNSTLLADGTCLEDWFLAQLAAF